MQPSGLIFLVIIAIWATYLLQHWVRRREHVATARSVDRFSDAMRVLDRRVAMPGLDLATQPRSYVVSPAGPARSEVPVQRLQPPRPISPQPTHVTSTTRGHHAVAGRSARRLRGLTLLASLCLVVITVPLALLSLVPVWGVPAALAALTADFAWLRRCAVAERSTRRAAASARAARAGVRRTATPAPRAAHPSGQAAATLPPSELVATAFVGSRVAAAELATSPAPADLSGWAPVPVPPPTYTLKAKAERPATVAPPVVDPVPALVVEPVPSLASSFDGLVDDDELDGLLDRRAAGA
ncbi:MAG: hypothetical protein ABI438_00785 [Dermatophilaceae bacterium]